MMSNGNLVTNRPVHYLAPKECEFSIGGSNLVTFRRAKLRLIAKSMSVSPDGSKQEILRRVIAKLKAMGAPKELSSELE